MPADGKFQITCKVETNYSYIGIDSIKWELAERLTTRHRLLNHIDITNVKIKKVYRKRRNNNCAKKGGE